MEGRLPVVSEHELVARCRQGDRAAQQELYTRTAEPVYRLLFRMTTNHEDACDLAQQTYLKAFTRIDQFDGRSKIATWLYRIAVNEALQFLRRPREILVERTRANTFREAATEQAGRRRDVNQALGLLPAMDRAMLVLRYQDGLDYRTLADVIGCREGTVASRLHRARARFRQIWREDHATAEGMGVAAHPRDSR